MKRTCFLLIFLQNALRMAADDPDRILSLEIHPRAAFTGERIVLTCLGSEVEVGYYIPYQWYKNNRLIKQTYDSEYRINSAKHSDRGTYRCEFKFYNWKWVSQDVELAVTGGSVVLQIDPLSVYEGDSLQLTCRCKSSHGRNQLEFYKDWTLIHSLKAKDKAAVHTFKVNSLEGSGSYLCAVGRKYSNVVRVDVRELFSKPTVQIEPEGGIFEALPLTLTCDVQSTRSNILLRYTFYKDFETLSANSDNNFLHQEAATIEDSGTYSCEANAQTQGVQKWSEYISITVEELFSKPTLRIDHALEVLEGDPLTLNCFVQTINSNTPLQYTFYKGVEVLNANSDFHEMHVKAVTLENSGMYSCEANPQMSYLRKKSDEVSISIRELFSKPILEEDYEAEIFEGEPLILTCFVQMISSDVHLEYTFYKDYEALNSISNNRQMHVEAVSLKDSGTYHCEANARIQAVTKISNEVFVSVNQIFSKPELRAESETQLLEGQILKLVCQVEIFRHISLVYEFYKDGTALHFVSDGNYYVTRTSWPDDAGVYQCEVTASRSTVKKMSNRVPISVRGTPVSKPVFTMSPTNELIEGGKALFICSVTNGSRPITYIFFKDGKKELHREESNRTEIPYEIINVNKSFEGNYSCVVGNAASELRLNSEFIHITVIVQSRATSITISVLASLLVVALIGLYLFRRRRKKQSESSSASQPQGMVTENGSQPCNEDTASANLEYAVVGTARNSDSTESAAGVVYSEITIKEPSNYVNAKEASGAMRNKAVSASDYSVVYAPVNHVKTGAGLERTDADEPDGSDTNFYENFARK
ncbi:Fc receptor-like protein 5 [Pristis pectinata]|uniref:Fc receptor-like protein 5 n=1 Tax=Pristis pectinata TaxID=685728 RepID=UPI00223D0972|nr:Fc receptor-like protein 5 [Pristis pectinata]XP_051864814.1 Fc receptor-like protein 5 [Pristis pectinata]